MGKKQRKFHLGFQDDSAWNSLPSDVDERYWLYWTPINQISWELESLLRDCGFAQALPSSINTVMIFVCYREAYELLDDRFGVWDELRWFTVLTSRDARRLPDKISDQERYWRESELYLQALVKVARHLEMPDPVCERLEGVRASMPYSAPWPSLPPFDIADVEKHFRENLEKPRRGRDGRLQKVRSMPREPGVLWVNCGPVAAPVDETIDRLQGDLREFVADNLRGEWDGDSRSGALSDISFRVGSLGRDGPKIAKFLKARWPTLDFYISDEYVPQVFEKSA